MSKHKGKWIEAYIEIPCPYCNYIVTRNLTGLELNDSDKIELQLVHCDSSSCYESFVFKAGMTRIPEYSIITYKLNEMEENDGNEII